MPSKSPDIPDLIRNEPVLQAALARGMINALGAARWLKEEYDLELENESIARHIREFDPSEATDDWVLGREALEGGRRETRPGMVLLVIRRSASTRKRMATILGNLDAKRMRALRIEPTDHHYQVAVTAELAGELQRELGDRWIKRVIDGLVDISVVTAETDSAPAPSLSVALRTLHERGIQVPFATAGPAGITLLVPEDQYLAAHGLIINLTEAEEMA